MKNKQTDTTGEKEDSFQTKLEDLLALGFSPEEAYSLIENTSSGNKSQVLLLWISVAISLVTLALVVFMKLQLPNLLAGTSAPMENSDVIPARIEDLFIEIESLKNQLADMEKEMISLGEFDQLHQDMTIATDSLDFIASNVTERPYINVDITSEQSIVKLGETIKYTYRITNTGNVTLTNIMVNDELVSDLLGPKQVWQDDNEIQVTETNFSKLVSIEAVVTAASPTKWIVSDSDVLFVDIVALDLIVEPIGVIPDVGEIIAITYTLKNIGNIPFISIEVDNGQNTNTSSEILEPDSAVYGVIDYTVMENDPMDIMVTVEGFLTEDESVIVREEVVVNKSE